ncbi:MAG: hypothetical protein B6D54_04540 [Epsilonproteobacteria bacterium 4484_65]|nr:MAG: hypothetical protein B6D54_04540 [Epsilonproteobacteria bacterium 4484_65]
MILEYLLLLSISISMLLSTDKIQDSPVALSTLNYEYHLERQSLEIQDIFQKKLSWKKHNSSTFKLLSQTSPVWFKFTLDPSSPHKNFLQINSEFIYLCEVYLFQNESLLKQYAFGAGVENELRNTELPQRLVPLDKSNYPTHIYIKIFTMPTLSVSFVLSDTTQTLAFLENKSFFNGIFYGILLFLFIYNFILYLYTQYSAYIPYLSYIFGITFYFLILDEYYIFSIWPALYDIYLILFEFFSMIIIVSMILFPIVLLKLKKQYPTVHKILMPLLALYIILLLASMYTEHYGYIAYYRNLYKITSSVSIILLMAVLFMALDLARKGKRIAIMYSIAWSILILAVVNYIGQNIILDSNILDARTYLMLAIVLEGLLFSFILAYQIRELSESKSQLEKVVIEQTNMVQTERMFTQIAHQWRSPLNTINAIVFEQMMQKELPDKKSWESTLNSIEDQTHYLSKTIEDFQYLHSPTQGKRSFSISEAVNESLKLLATELNDKEIEISINIDEDLTLEGIKTHYIQVLLILLNNAIDVLSKKEGQKKIIIESKRDKNYVLLTLEDNGGGIEKSNLDKIFDLYFSTKKERSNMGMGLFMAKKFMEISLNGSLEVKNGREGACFTLGCCHV